MKFFVSSLISFTCLLSINKASLADEKIMHTFDFDQKFPSPCDLAPCHDIKSLIKHGLGFSYDTREAIELLFQARTTALQKLGHILPHINLGSAVSMGVDKNKLDFISSFVGFLFPNRWLDWRKDRQEAASELESYKTLLANRANAIQAVYLSIQTQVWNIRIIQHYLQEMAHIINFLQEQKDTRTRHIDDDDISVLQNLIAKLKYDLAFQDNLSATFPELAQAIGLEIKPSDNEMPLKPTRIKSLKSIPLAVESRYVTQALLKSTELKGLDHMIAAAKSGKKSNYFEFFDPATDSELGYGYGQRIKIANSSIKVIEIQKERTKSEISLLIFRTINNYNDALAACNAADDGLAVLEKMRVAIDENLKRTDIPFDINKAVRYFDIAAGAAIRYSTSYFLFKISEAALHRSTWEGSIYKIVQNYIDLNIEKNYQQAKINHSWFYRKFCRKKIARLYLSTAPTCEVLD